MNHIITIFKTIFSFILRKLSRCLRHTRLRFVIAVAVLGTFNHFFYFLSGHSAIIALFCPINESVWEHLKLLFFPFLFVSVWEYLQLQPSVLHFFYCRYLGAVIGMLFIVSVFYTYSGIIGRSFVFFDILIFYASVIFAFCVSEYVSGHPRLSTDDDAVFVISLWVITSFFFFVFTCLPPELPLFYSP